MRVFYCDGENCERKVYFISAGCRMGDGTEGFNLLPGYVGHLSGTMTSYKGDGMNTVMTFCFSRLYHAFYTSFGGDTGFSEIRASAAQVRCVRDE